MLHLISLLGSSKELGLNGTYLVDFLKTIGGEGEVRITLKYANFVAVIMPEDITAQYRQHYVVMPIRMRFTPTNDAGQAEASGRRGRHLPSRR